MVAVPSKITARVIQQPEYVDADTYGVWKRLNLWDVYCATAEENDEVARVFRTNDEAAAYEAGVPARGEI
jgi:hypothetical protein